MPKATQARKGGKSTKAAKKSIAKSPKTSSSKKSSTQKKTGHKWAPSHTKTIKMFKEQPDYFQLNERYAHEGLGTRLVHCGSEPGQEYGGVSTTLDFSSTFAQPAPGSPVVFDYARCGNPTRLALERNLACMEKARYALAMSSGMSAHVTITQLVKKGEHILCVDDVYGGTQRYLRRILGPNAEVEVTFEDFSDIKHFKKGIKN